MPFVLNAEAWLNIHTVLWKVAAWYCWEKPIDMFLYAGSVFLIKEIINNRPFIPTDNFQYSIICYFCTLVLIFNNLNVS